MSAITIENDLVHYEVLGRGRPVIFVHGWLGSWRYWVPTMQQLSVKYRTYALDLWGFGDSGKETTRYSFKDQVKLLNDFMEKLGIAKAALVGHSFGAAICLRYASQYPDRAPRLALISPPLFDPGGTMEAAPAVATPTQVSVSSTTAAKAPTPPAPVPSAVPVTASGSAAAPAASTSPAVTSVPAPSATPAAPSASATSGTPAPAGATGSPAASAGTTPASTSAPAPSVSTPTPPPVPAPAAPPMPLGSHNTDTIPRNPFRGLGETPEEILARLQAKNVVSATGSTPPPGTTPSAPVLPPSAPALPISIGKPILKSSAPATAPETAPAVPAPRTDADNPLMQRLTGIKPVQLLAKHVDHNSPDFEKLKAEVEKTDESAILRSVQSFNGVNLALELQKLAAPTLLLHGRGDTLLDAPSDDLVMRIGKGKPEGHLLAFVEEDLKHFPMLEITAKFNRLLMDFFEAQDLTNVQFKDQWRRTMR